MVTTDIGRRAEAAVGEYLSQRGFKILAYNWMTPRCEIDIVVRKDNVAYLVEVKYRGAGAQGSGFEYIGPKKLKQMNYAAEVWTKDNGWDGDICLVAAEVSDNFNVINLVEV